MTEGGKRFTYGKTPARELRTEDISRRPAEQDFRRRSRSYGGQDGRLVPPDGQARR